MKKGVSFMKKLFKRFCCGVVTAIGIEVGLDTYRKLKNPANRVKLKKRFIRIRDAITGKEES
jgi:hypothetical protein